MTKLYILCFIAIILDVVYEPHVSGIGNLVKKGADAVHSGVSKIGDTVIEQGFTAFCAGTGECVKQLKPLGLGFTHCDKAHADQPWCKCSDIKVIDNSDTLHNLLCGLAKDKGKDFFAQAMVCFKMPDATKKQDCMAGWFQQIESCKDTAALMGDAVKG
ncbi:unnamed protein product [Oppiella nova]|uniref:Uncharacterized protein n=1 Tax=Oppiella nova TaxID=334625 RepID=A0A7R9M654_9ACAR|nr:unnamed protein product [Oppiella nova]CAG2171374.1 unnamed protein product [Oppiella nova]